MPTFELEANVKSYEIEAPDQNTAVNAFKSMSSGGSAPSPVYDQAADIVKGFGGGLVRGAAGTVGLVTDTIPGFLADQINWLDGKVRETPEKTQARMAERRENSPLRQFSPALADAARSVGEHLTTQGLQRDIESVTGPAYVPHTRAGKFASTAASSSLAR
jgi:hypothetical protein